MIKKDSKLKKLTLCVMGLAVMVLGGCSTYANSNPSGARKPLKIFVLAGQPSRQERTSGESPKVWNDVYIAYLSGSQDKATVKAGKLGATAADGLRPEKGSPEYAFGAYMGDVLDEPIVIIRTAWGGGDIETGFRPPSAGNGTKDRKGGSDYTRMVGSVQSVLQDIKSVYPDYDPRQGYRLAGFVWLQDYNDKLPDNAYTETFNRQSQLLAHLIRDVRKTFDAPRLPFVIAATGLDGSRADDKKMQAFRQAMAAPAAMDEFAGTVATVGIGTYQDYRLEIPLPNRGEVAYTRLHAHDISKDGKKLPTVGWKSIGTPGPDERKWRYKAISPEPEKTYDPLSSESKAFQYVATDESVTDWYKPGFDASAWKSGKAPIGLGTFQSKKTGIGMNNQSDWGDGDYLMMRTTFEMDHLDYVRYRISVLSNSGYVVYLNGHKVYTYPWWKNDPFYRAVELDKEATRHLKKGTNLLAVYAKARKDRKNNVVAQIDVDVEGLTKEDNETLKKYEYTLITPEEREVFKRRSNAYLYKKPLGQKIGKVFAEDLLEPKVSFGIVTDIHYADKPGTGRVYRDSLDKLTECVTVMNEKKVDFLVGLGDFIDTGGKGTGEEAAFKHLDAVEKIYRTFNGPRYHVLGNHDMDKLSKAQFLSRIENTGIDKNASYYSYDHNGFHFVVLDACFTKKFEPYDRGKYSWADSWVPPQQQEWLKKDLASTEKPVIVFLHQVLFGMGMRTVKNAAEVRALLEADKNVLAVFQGHHHGGGYQYINGIHYYNLKAMVEGAGETNSSYAIVDVHVNNSMTVTGYRKAVSKKMASKKQLGANAQ